MRVRSGGGRARTDFMNHRNVIREARSVSNGRTLTAREARDYSARFDGLSVRRLRLESVRQRRARDFDIAVFGVGESEVVFERGVGRLQLNGLLESPDRTAMQSLLVK